VKKLLIIQQDDAYFLFETIQVIEKNSQTFKDYDLTLLVNETSLDKVYSRTFPVIKGITTSTLEVANKEYDVSVNLSLDEKSWDFHGGIKSPRKLGMYKQGGQLLVEDLWSSLLLTLKSKAPFLTYHLQDIYKNILGIKSFALSRERIGPVKQIAYQMVSPELFPAVEQETFINELAKNYPATPIRDLTEIDLISDVTHTLYIGPANLEALKFCEAGGRGIFLSSAFRGFNLSPSGKNHLHISSRNTPFQATPLLQVVLGEISGKTFIKSPYSLYKVDNENTFGSYLESLNESDDSYPVYQSYLVLWNYLLNLFDTDLEVTQCNKSQLNLLKEQSTILTKVIRFHDYAMSAIDSIYHEAKSPSVNEGEIGIHMKKLIEIEAVLDQLAAGHPLLRPVLDFYRIRKGQNNGVNLLEQSQVSFLTYAEEHQALQALHELFSVTLKKNEVNI
jgi:DNA polymerase III psi subunit